MTPLTLFKPHFPQDGCCGLSGPAKKGAALHCPLSRVLGPRVRLEWTGGKAGSTLFRLWLYSTLDRDVWNEIFTKIPKTSLPIFTKTYEMKSLHKGMGFGFWKSVVCARPTPAYEFPAELTALLNMNRCKIALSIFQKRRLRIWGQKRSGFKSWFLITQ